MKYKIQSTDRTLETHQLHSTMPSAGDIITIETKSSDTCWICTDGWMWHPDDLELYIDEVPTTKPSTLRVTVTDKTEQTDLPATPFLAQCGEDIIIVQDYNSVHFKGVGIAGTVVGEYSDTWNRESFDPFHGIVTLES